MKEKITCIDCLTNKTVQVELADNILQSVKTTEKAGDGNIYIGPGLTDIQINGYVNIDFNTFPITEEGMLKVIQAMVAEGVTSFFPTVITNSDELIISVLKNIHDLCLQNPKINSHATGIHLEGPFISPSDEARGAHDIRYIKSPDWDLFQRFREASGNRIKIITLCPEWKNATDFIRRCVNENIIVAIGHTNASPKRIIEAVEAGATLSTHIGNGAPLMLHRNTNFIYEQLAQDRLYSSLIADGFHLPPGFLKVVLKMKQDHAILISDSTMFAGMECGVYDTHIGGKVILEEGGRLSMYENQKLMAGSAISVLDGINYLLKSNLADLRHAWSYGSVNPNKLINNYQNYLNNPESSDLVLFRYNKNKISIIAVFKNAKCIYSVNSY
ncbi:MAG: hypothetical protein JXB00_01190 [Bacteroidales bacterium]|nr:hypothetical protein [Bacteroidales bacterium]